MDQMDVVGLIAAMTQESTALLRLVKPWERIAIGRLPAYTFSLSGHPYVLVTSGMGVRRAGEAARLLVKQCSPRLLISFGIAGAVGPDLEIGDVILADAYCRLDHGIPGSLLPLTHWPETAREAAAQALSGGAKRILTGTAVTTGGSQVSQSQLGGMPHPVLEMETAGIAQVAAEHGLSLLSLRAISDGPNAPIPLDLSEVMDDDANLRISKLLGVVLHNPKVVFQSGRMMRNNKIAADRAAVALVAALSKLTD